MLLVGFEGESRSKQGMHRARCGFPVRKSALNLLKNLSAYSFYMCAEGGVDLNTDVPVNDQHDQSIHKVNWCFFSHFSSLSFADVLLTSTV